MTPPAMAPTGGPADDADVDVAAGFDVVGVVGLLLLAELIVEFGVEFLVGFVELPVELAVELVGDGPSSDTVDVMSKDIVAVTLTVVTSQIALLPQPLKLPSRQLTYWRPLRQETVELCNICLFSFSTRIGSGFGATVTLAVLMEVGTSAFIISDGTNARSSRLTAVGKLRFGPLSFRTAAWRDLRPKIPVLPAKRDAVASRVDVTVSV